MKIETPQDCRNLVEKIEKEDFEGLLTPEEVAVAHEIDVGDLKDEPIHLSKVTQEITNYQASCSIKSPSPNVLTTKN